MQTRQCFRICAALTYMYPPGRPPARKTKDKGNSKGKGCAPLTVPVELDASGDQRVEHRRLHVPVIGGAVPTSVAPAIVVLRPAQRVAQSVSQARWSVVLSRMHPGPARSARIAPHPDAACHVSRKRHGVGFTAHQWLVMAARLMGTHNQEKQDVRLLPCSGLEECLAEATVPPDRVWQLRLALRRRRHRREAQPQQPKHVRRLEAAAPTRLRRV
jgi:hypothetical protein